VKVSAGAFRSRGDVLRGEVRPLGRVAGTDGDDQVTAGNDRLANATVTSRAVPAPARTRTRTAPVGSDSRQFLHTEAAGIVAVDFLSLDAVLPKDGTS
jgi:hypothetical protein